MRRHIHVHIYVHTAKLVSLHVTTCVGLCLCVHAYRLTALVSPHMQLLGQLRYNQECPPALTFLGLEDVAENVVPDVDDVLPLGPQQVAYNVRGT